MYQSSHFHQATPLAMSLIAETASDPSFLAEEIDAQREAARYEIREVNAKPEMMLPEVLHDVAYNGQTLGNPLMCPEERIDLITSDLLRKTRAEWYRPERMVIAGSGMLHEELVELAEKHFSHIPYVPSPTMAPPLSRPIQHPAPPHLLPSGQPSVFSRAASYLSGSSDLASPLSLDTNSKVSYTGGHRFLHDPSSEFNHLYLAFEGMGIHDKDIYALATIQVLLGGGGSFSAGKLAYFVYYQLVLTHALRWTWKGHVLTTIHSHPQPLCTNRPLRVVQPHLHRLVAVWIICDVLTKYTAPAREHREGYSPPSDSSIELAAIHAYHKKRAEQS